MEKKIELSELGKALKHARQEKGLNKKQVADILRKGFSTIESYEQGKREPALMTIMDLFALYGFRVRFVLEDRNNESDS